MRLFVDDKLSSIDEICTLLKIKKTNIPFHHKSRIFKRLNLDNKKDPQTGKPIIPRGHGILCTMQVTLPGGETAKITFSETQTPDRKVAGLIKHSPLLIDFPGITMMMPEDVNPSKFFYIYIHTYNKNSPLNLGVRNPNCIYEFLDKEALAKEDNDKEDLIYDAMTLMKKLDELSARQIAKGYKVNNVDDLTFAEVQSELRKKLKDKPGQFILDLEDNEIALEGIIRDAMDKGIITKTLNGTQNIWILGDKELARCPSAGDQMMYLKSVIEADLDTLFPLIQNGIDTNIRASKLKKPEINKHFDRFKGQSDNYVPLDHPDFKVINDQRKEEDRLKQLRNWYHVDVNDPSIHQATKAAVLRKGEELLAQFRLDKQAGLIPEGQAEPVVVLASELV